MIPEKPNEIRVYRTYNAPVKALWNAIADPQEAFHWWGPRGFTITNHSKDFRVGGIWHYTMHGPNKADYINKAKYLEIDPLKKMVYDQGGNDETKPFFRVTMNFIDAGSGKSILDMCMAFETPEIAANTREFVKKVGGDTTWDRLEDYLREKSARA